MLAAFGGGTPSEKLTFLFVGPMLSIVFAYFTHDPFGKASANIRRIRFFIVSAS